MSRQSAPCEYRRTASPSRRGGMTLIEIMMAILILSIGLLGVLASVPFGAVQMGRMVEKDYVTAAARNGQSILKMNRWLLPDQWCVAVDSSRITADGAYFNASSWDDVVVRYKDAGGLNASTFLYPVMIDPLGFPEYPFGSGGVNPRQMFIGSFPPGNDKIDFVFPFDNTLRNITPDGLSYTVSGVIAEDAGKLDRLFHSVDDLTYELEANSTNRPILLEDTETPGTAAFTGEYSWMAMLSPSAVGAETSSLVTSGTPHYEPVPLWFPSENPEAVVDVRSDVVVFRGRVPGDEFDYITADVAVGVTGFAGGAMTLVLIANNCYRCAADDYNGVLDAALSAASAKDLLANVESSAYLLLIGPKDDNGTGVARPFCRWYKIANSSATVFNDTLDAVDVTLIGENCPENWGNTTGRVKAVVFKNVRGVLSQTTRLTGETVAGN